MQICFIDKKSAFFGARMTYIFWCSKQFEGLKKSEIFVDFARQIHGLHQKMLICFIDLANLLFAPKNADFLSIEANL